MLLITASNEYPRYVGDLKLAFPNWQDGDDLPDGWHLVTESPIIKGSAEEFVFEVFPTLVNGVYVQTWAKRDLTEEELEIRQAPAAAKQRLLDLGFTEAEIQAIKSGLV